MKVVSVTNYQVPIIVSDELYSYDYNYSINRYLTLTNTAQDTITEGIKTILDNLPIANVYDLFNINIPSNSNIFNYIENSATSQKFATACYNAGIYNNILPNVPSTNNNVDFNGTTGTVSTKYTSISAQCYARAYCNKRIYQSTMLPSVGNYYYMPSITLLILPANSMQIDKIINDSSWNTMPPKAINIGISWRENYKELNIYINWQNSTLGYLDWGKNPSYADLNWLNDITIPELSDPYTNIIPESTTGGGNGNGNFTDDTIDEPSTPTVSGINSGFISAYSPSIAQLNALASYMWTSDFTTNLNKVFGDNPMGTILGLSAIPVSPNTGNPQNVILGNVDTKIEMPVITSQYVKFNCGSINIQPKYGAFLDYEPYTSIDLFLPYIGLVQLSTNDVMGKSLAVTYTIDVLSGACVANVACGGTIMYTFEGACATQFPVTNNDYSNMFKAAIDAASSIVGAIGGAVASGMTGNVAGAVGAIADGMAGAAQAAMNAHPVVNRSGSLSGSAGLMGIQKPFIVWTTPNMVASNNQNSFIGYPNFVTTSLSSLSGYTEVENINLGIAGATNEEVNEIKTLLRNGVIF